ncbi:MAG: hypothetical protein M4D80_01095 [Myxococcota bacterium]|nr:hypothetical protein [Myxococcota bacterium]
MFRSCLFVVLVGCGGSSKPAVYSDETEHIQLEPTVAAQTWYRAPTICGQGPYEVELLVEGAKWGEEVVLFISTPRGVRLHASIVGDDQELAKAAGLFGGATKAENVRCIADAKERLAAVRGDGGGGGTVVPNVPTGTAVVIPPPSPPVQIIVEEGIEPQGSVEVVRWRVPEQRARRVRIRWWSVEPNDLEGVRFGVARIVWGPNVSEAEYEAYLVRRERRLAARRESPEESRARWVRQNADAQRRLAEESERDRKRAIKTALEVERRRRFDAYCASHHESRDCWGAGGKRGWAELQDRVRQREGYCASHGEDARCWSSAERARRERAWEQRVRDASAPPKQPDGPPPAPRDETPPPKLSDNAEWRPGYWSWTGTTWLWLSGMWRVPEADIVAEKTTTAPVAPPPPRVEEVPPPPMPTTIWVSGFWQWDGRGYIWVPGSYQARPETGMSWRPTEWRARGRVHVLVPGGWVQIGGRR